VILLDNTPPLLQFENVSYTYPGANKPAIENLSLTIPAGKKTAILGHNGCGKSTLLLLADGLYRCSAGMISWQGEALQYQARSLNQWRQRIGLAFQDPEQQLVAATVAEDISYGLCNLQLSQAEIAEKLHQTLIDFNLQELANQPLHHLSLGQKRRVALAGVMALQPQLLLLDEPTAYLDRLQTRHLMQELDRIHGHGTTIVMATHDLDLVYAWADWAIVLHQGRALVSDRAFRVFSNVALLEQLELGMPTLLEIWNALPMALRDRQSPPKTVAELRLVMTPNQQKTLEVAQKAFSHLTHGLATGEWEEFLNMMTDDFTFWFPVGQYHGLNVGKQKTKEFLEYVSQSFKGGISITSIERITSSETTVVFEFRDEGKLQEEPYKNRVAVSFDIREDKICAYREYFGSDGKSN